MYGFSGTGSDPDKHPDPPPPNVDPDPPAELVKLRAFHKAIQALYDSGVSIDRRDIAAILDQHNN